MTAPISPALDWEHPAFEVALDHPLVRDPAEDVVLRVLAPRIEAGLDLLIRFTRTEVVESDADGEFDGRFDVMTCSSITWEFAEASKGGRRYNQSPKSPNVSDLRAVPLGTVIAAAAKYLDARRSATRTGGSALLDQDLELARTLRGTRSRRGEFLAAIYRLSRAAFNRNPTAPVAELAALLEVDPRQARRWIAEARQASRKEEKSHE